MEPCIKVLGADFELANAIESEHHRRGDVEMAARRLLQEIPGYPQREIWGGTSLEWGRRFLASTGGSAYIDSDHLELNLPEHTRAADHPALVHASLRLAREAQVAATARLGDGERINVTTAVSDANHSWGHHLNVMVRRELFDEMFYRKPHLAGWLATHLATATLFTGQGKVGPGFKASACEYQLSQRADYFEELVGLQTTYSRPLLNVRDEPHAAAPYARMHIIFFDRVLCPIANYLMTGTTQLVLAMAEAGWINVGLLLDDPLDAAHAVSRDLTLRQPLRLAQRGKSHTAVEVQRGLADLAGEFVQSGLADSVVPGAAAIVQCWQETLALLTKRDLLALMRRCDWALKYLLLDRLRTRQGLGWSSPEIRALDFRYSSLDPAEGLFWQMAAAGQIDQMPTPAEVARFYHEPPTDTRAYLRAHVLRRFGEEVTLMDWEALRFRLPSDRYWWSHAILGMPDPTEWGQAMSDPLLQTNPSLQELVDTIGDRGVKSSEIGLASWSNAGWGRRGSELVVSSNWNRS